MTVEYGKTDGTKLYLIILTVLAVTVFDLLLASNSFVPLRFVYDLSFALIMLAVLYVSILFLRNRQMPKRGFSVTLPRATFALPILLNLLTVFSTVRLETPDTGFLNGNFLIQGAYSLFPLLNYLLIMMVNGVLLYVAVNRKREMHAYELPTYLLGMVAIETFLSIYSFYLGGIAGIRLCLSLFHLGVCGAFLYLYYRSKTKAVTIHFELSDLLLSLLAVGILMLVFVPYGIYNLMYDNAIVTSSALSITQRGSLQPYYWVTDYYSPIGGFVAVAFTYLCGLSNILLASNLPFLASYLTLPFVAYYFLRKHYTEDPRMAIIGAVAAILMDGLAVLLLPPYRNNLTMSTVNWQISPATESLYSSTICWLWLDPFKTFSIATAVAVGNMASKRASSLLVAGTLLALSFTNPRQPFMAILILLLLLGAGRLRMKDILMIILSSILAMGPIFLDIAYKVTENLLLGLSLTGLITNEVLTRCSNLLVGFTDNTLLQVVLIAITLVILIFSFRIGYTSMERNIKAQTRPSLSRKKVLIKLRFSWTNHKLSLGGGRFAFWSLSIIVLSYVALQAYQTPFSLNLQNNALMAPLNYLIMRYHILLVLIILGFFQFITRKHTGKLLFALATVAIASYLGVTLGLYVPIIFVVMALPAFGSLVNSQKKIRACLILSIIVLGVFSATFYSATVKKIELEEQPYFDDMPHVIRILINQNTDMKVFCPSSYNYYASRIVGMAQLSLTSDQSSPLWIIDTRYTESAEVRNLLSENGTKVLYQGEVFILLERTP